MTKEFYLIGDKDVHPGVSGVMNFNSDYSKCNFQNHDNLPNVREVTELEYTETLSDESLLYSDVAYAGYEAGAIAAQEGYDKRKPHGDRNFKALEWAMKNGTEEQLTKGGTWLEADDGDGGNLGNVQTVAKKKWYLARTNLADQVTKGMKEADIVALILANRGTMEWVGITE